MTGRRWLSTGSKLDVHWSHGLTPGVEEFLANARHGVAAPPALLQLLLTGNDIHEKEIGVICANGRTLAAVPLRRIGRNWEPLLARIVPGYATVIGELPPRLALPSLSRSIFVRDSRDPPLAMRNVRRAATGPTHDLSLRADPEEFWRERGRWPSIITARRRTELFELVVDSTEAARWTIDNWAAYHWRGPDGVTSLAEDRLIATLYGLEHGSTRCWALRDSGRWVAGCIATVVSGELAFTTVYRRREYDWHSPGSRLFYEAVTWAKESGLQRASFGGHFAYKRHWAPASGLAWNYLVSPFRSHIVAAARSGGATLLARRR
jgi:Acetyltransferase (GNAT) domain